MPIPGIENLNLTKYQYYADLGVNIFDPEDPYFTDRCIPIRKNSTQSTILSRRDEFSKFQLTCSPGCVLKGINITSGYMDCNCKVTDNNIKIFSEIGNKVLSIITSVNIEILKCVEAVFSYVYFYLILA